MKIGRLIGRNVFTGIWLLGITLYFLGTWLGAGYEAEPRFPFLGPVFYSLYVYIFRYIFGFITWPHKILLNILFDPNNGINVEWIADLSLIISLGSFIAIDFLLRKFLWDKKQVPKKILL